MKIVKAEAFLCDVAVETTRTDTIQSFAKQETIFVDIETEDGLVGTGYSYTIGTGGRAVGHEQHPSTNSQVDRSTIVVHTSTGVANGFLGLGGAGPLAHEGRIGREVSMKITQMDVSLHRLPLEEPWGDSTHRITHIELILCKLSTDTPHNGVGYSYTVGSGGAAVATLMRTYLTPIVVGEHASYIERLWHRLWQECHDAGARGIGGLAINAIDVALWDLAGKTAGKPLFQLLGGAREKIVAYGSGVNLHLSRDELLSQVEGWLSRGYEAVKIKVGSEDPDEDAQRVSSVRELIGWKRRLMVDANQAWTASEAVARTRMLEPYRPYWMEEPLISDDVLGHARLRGAVSTAIAVGENIHSRFEMATYVQLGAVDIVQADVVRIGGITEWLKVAHMADAFNLKVAPHFVLELSGSLLCAVPNALILEDVEGGSLTELGVLEEPLPVKNGYWTPSQRPGHGIVFSRSALEETEVRGEGFEVRSTRQYGL